MSEPQAASAPEALGRAFAAAIAAKDRRALERLLAPEVDFRGVTPNHLWEATDPEGVAEIVFGSWFEPHDHVREVLDVTTAGFADRHVLHYRFLVDSEGEPCLVEQHGYFDALDGRFTKLNLVCSGFRPTKGTRSA